MANILVKYLSVEHYIITNTEAENVVVSGNISLDDLINVLTKRYGEEFQKYLKENGEIRPEFWIIVDGRDCRSLSGLKTLLKDNTSVSFVKLLAGG
jgi:molybdopterin converting factor small subunit